MRRRVTTSVIRKETQLPYAEYHVVWNPRYYYGWVTISTMQADGLIYQHWYPRLNFSLWRAEAYPS